MAEGHVAAQNGVVRDIVPELERRSSERTASSSSYDGGSGGGGGSGVDDPIGRLIDSKFETWESKAGSRFDKIDAALNEIKTTVGELKTDIAVVKLKQSSDKQWILAILVPLIVATGLSVVGLVYALNSSIASNFTTGLSVATGMDAMIKEARSISAEIRKDREAIEALEAARAKRDQPDNDPLGIRKAIPKP